jgi:hypothetical protein
MEWHWENRSTREGGDNLVRHLVIRRHGSISTATSILHSKMIPEMFILPWLQIE